jgi:hypothetical protein
MVTIIKKGTPLTEVDKKVKAALKRQKKPHVTDFAGKMKWGKDPVEYQRELRDEWG